MRKKKILFVTSRSPFSSIFSGDRQRARSIIEYLNKKNNLDIIYTDKSEGLNKPKNLKSFFFKRNLFERIINIAVSLFKLKPLQLGYFYSNDIYIYIRDNHEKYDTIIFHLIRSAQYLPKNFRGKTILEMTDMLSKNYGQIVKNFSIFNPLTYIYFLEMFLVKKYESYCAKYFDKIVLASKNDLNESQIKDKNKFIEIPNTVNLNKNIYSYKVKNKKILFIGNLNYLPNKEACINFVKNILPKLKLLYPDIEFHIIGEVKNLDRFFFKNKKGTFIHGPLKNINSLVKGSICGICNVEIATGTQMKMLTYMSHGLPCIASLNSFKNTFFSKGKEVLVYKNELEFIKVIKKLKDNKKFSKTISKNSYNGIKKKYNKNKIFSLYDKII